MVVVVVVVVRTTAGGSMMLRRAASSAAYWRAVHALPEARRPNARAEMTHLRAVPHRAGSELTRRQTTRPLRRLAPAVARHA
eukprot:COSAG01_NODE_2822_length_7009_cov_3.862663_5_plen_82_part_00